MSTHKYIDRVCAAAMVLSLVLTALFVNGGALGVQAASRAMGYESRLFDTSRVHTIHIVMDGWEEFLETCENEEYSPCAVVVDGDSWQNVGLRAKGNTSLSTVSSLGSDRYSFKLEFDQYDAGKTYYGLDKLCLNNIIQDDTYMKDYLTYRLMASFGVSAPLCSYVYLTVNGEDWGLYLAVEGLEDSFLQRNYGADHGALYKPDSMSFGGGRGNGRQFDMGDFDFSQLESFTPPEDFTPPDLSQRGDRGGPGGGEGAADGGAAPSPGGGRGMGGGPGGGMGSSDVKLQYTDDDPDSYANIFDNAKTPIDKADRERLIRSLKALSQGDVDHALDVDAVLRYLVVHNYVVNGDSYTGSMVHNYYLYEEEGRLSMLPWDYNLAFGTFQGSDASAAVNDPIDTPLSVTGSGDRPMADWIFASEEHTRLYHQYFQQFLDTVDIDGIIVQTRELIAPYVEKDPTSFCTYEEFQTGAEALRTFCRLRTESVSGQLAGTIPSTSQGQSERPDALVDASGLKLSDMGTMGHGGGFPGGGPGGDRSSPDSAAQPPEPAEEDRPQPGEAVQAGNFPGRPQAGGAPNGPGGDGFPSGGQPSAGTDRRGPVLLGVSALFLAVGLLIAFKYRR